MKITSLRGKVAVITGAARGIGLAFARAYLAEGAEVAIADINLSAAEKAAESLGPKAHAIALDVTRQDSIDAGFAEAVAKMGKLDILINNAAQTVRRSPGAYAPLIDAESIPIPDGLWPEGQGPELLTFGHT